MRIAAQARKRFFLKKDAKTFAAGDTRRAKQAPNKQEFFGSFLQKRTTFLPLAKRDPGPCHGRHARFGRA